MTQRLTGRALDAVVRNIRLVVFDFDGVFTDNTVMVFDDGREAVSCWRGDGFGLRALQQFADVFVLSTERNPVVGVRCKKLSMPFTQGCEDKRTALLAMAEERGVGLDQIAYVGNDINDLECLQMVGLPIVVSDAHPSVIGAAKWRTKLPGGRGAVREVCDMMSERMQGAAAAKGKRRVS
jgi:3-deoxy-D-manno-octulosonate 8-phosphate phosphatase (KDO 8-P phosphatase)